MGTLVLFAALCVGAAPGERQSGSAGSRQSARREEHIVQGHLKNWSDTRGLEGLQSAFQYLQRTDLAALPLGRTDIEGDDVYVTMSEAETKAPTGLPFEAHRRYIDIQLVVAGQETIGFAPIASLKTTEPYDAAKDIEFFAPPAQFETVVLRPGDFAVFAPGGGHRPGIHLDAPHVSRKAVVKVSVAWRDRHRGK
jgi:YhcH/YjgK/YiaL family protein